METWQWWYCAVELTVREPIWTFLLFLFFRAFFYEWKIFRLFISSCLIVASLTSSTAIENFQQFSFFVSTVRRFMYRWICKTIWLSISGICRVYEVDLPLNCVYLLTTTLHAVLYGEMKNENLSAAQLIASFCVCLNHLRFYKPSSSDIVSSLERWSFSSVVVERRKWEVLGSRHFDRTTSAGRIHTAAERNGQMPSRPEIDNQYCCYVEFNSIGFCFFFTLSHNRAHISLRFSFQALW